MFKPRRSPGDFKAEIEAHLQLEIDRLREQGMNAADAEAAARRAFGNVTASEERFYEAGRLLFADRLVQDLHFALRLLVRTPILTAAILLTLALGIGATSAVFSLVHAVVLRPLPYEKPEELVQLWESGPRGGGEGDWVAFPNFQDWRTESRSFQGMAAYRYAFATLTGKEGAESLLGLEVTDRLFEVLGVAPLFGRTFLPGEDAPGRENVAVISHALWQKRFGGDPAVATRALDIDGRSYSIVGVMPQAFAFPTRNVPGDTVVPVEIWIPMRPSSELEDRGSHNYWVVARLGEGRDLALARAEMSTVAAALARQYPASNQDMGVTVVRLHDYVAGDVRPALLLLLGAVTLLLLLACANVANLLLSRAEARRREMAVRHALGAGQGRLVQQVLTESLLLSVGGGAAGVAVAYVLLGLGRRLGPANIPRLQEAAIDGPVLLFATAAAVGVGLAFGLVPALLGARGNVHDTLKEAGSRTSAGRAGRVFRRGLVAAQVSLALMLLVGAGLLVQSFAQVAGLELGFRPARLLTAVIGLSPARYGDPRKQSAFFEEALRGVRGLPGVVFAGASNSLPLSGINDQGSFAVEGWPELAPGEDGPQANHPRVSAGYLEAMGIRLLDGRVFDDRDLESAPRVAVVSDLAARAFWPGTNPIGKRLAVDWPGGQPRWHEIVGVVQATRHFGLEAVPKPEVYVPHTQSPTPFMSLVVRVQGDPSSLTPAIREHVARLDPDVALFGFRTMDELVSSAGARRRFQAALVSAFAGLALLLAALGVYGVMAHMVAQRHREIGVRLALGARPREVVALVMGSGVKVALVGSGVGLVLALGLSRSLEGLLFGVSSLDLRTYLGTAVALLFVASLAAFLASRAAATVNPLTALRDE